MKRLLPILFAALLVASAALAAGPNPRVALDTSMGVIVVELDAEKAPLSTENFLAYVDAGHYADTVFHRVIKGFMIQGGGMTDTLTPKPTRPPIKNEAGNGLKNKRGTISMARTGVIDSATCQFFINTVDNAFLDHVDDSMRGYGYAVFGKVVEGMDVVDKIEASKTGVVNRMKDVPLETVVIRSAKRLP